jgi:hypothetical protein
MSAADEQLFKISVGFEIDAEPLTFNFITLPKGSRMNVNPTFLPHVVKLADAHEDIVYSQAIRGGVTGHGTAMTDLFASYYVLFFTSVESSKKQGVLITVDENRQAMVSGAWPTSFRDKIIQDPKSLIDIMHELAVRPEQFEQVTLLATA